MKKKHNSFAVFCNFFFGECRKEKEKIMSALGLSLKRKRGPGASVLDAAKKAGSIARTEYVNTINARTHPRAFNAQMNAYIPKGRSAIRHILKGRYAAKFANRSMAHAHDLMRKFNRGKPVNGVKAFLNTIK